MTNDEQAIIDLTRENGRLKREIENLEREQSHAKTAMRKVGVPSGFEDGNSYDDLSMGEQVSILCNMYEREKSRHNAHVDLPPRTSPQNKQDASGG